MRAVVFDGPGAVRVATVDDPILEESDDAILRVTRTAICGSDLHLFHLRAPVEPGDVLGHEAVGIVESVGPAVQTVSPGARAVASFQIACGACWFCVRGQSQLCEDFRNLGAGIFGGSLPGAQAERVRIPHADVNLLRVPDGLDDDRAVFVGDVATTGRYAAGLAAPTADETVAVIGAGPLGNLCIQALVAGGAQRVIAVDLEPSRLALAAAAGAMPIHAGSRHPVTAIAELTEGRGADVVVEAVGSPAAFETAVDAVRRGGRVVVVGLFAGEEVGIQLGVYWARSVTLVFAGVCPVHAWWERTMEAITDGSIDPTPLISHRLPLEEAARGYELFDRHEATKVILIP